MPPDHLPRPLRLALYGAASLVLLYLCLAPSDTLPQPGLGDKWEHTVAWFVLALTGLALSPRRPRVIAAYSLALALVVEILQAAMPFGRHGDWRDLVADTLGVAAAYALAWGVRRLFFSRRAGQA